MPRKPPPGSSSRRRATRRRSSAPSASLRLPTRLRVVRREHTLVYGLRLLEDQVLEEGEHEHVPLPRAGAGETLTLHQIVGDRAEIRRKLLESIDAYFEILGDTEE
jgi:hypothetical protein